MFVDYYTHGDGVCGDNGGDDDDNDDDDDDDDDDRSWIMS